MPKQPIEHAGETLSNQIRAGIADTEPYCQRTQTPSLAVLARSEGAYHYTPEGRRLADFTSGVLVANLGHNPTDWWQRVLQYMQLDKLNCERKFTSATALTAYNAITPIELQANQRLLANMRSQPGGARMEQVLWCASGSEAVQKALWAALRYRDGADIMLATHHGFHGKKGLAGAVTGTPHDPDRDPRVRFLDFPTEECRSFARRQQRIDLAPYRKQLEGLKTEFGSRICCLVTEPYLGGGGSYHPQPEYLQMLQQFCRQNDALFMLDEIQSNFGRTGAMYAFTTYGVEPDIVLLGKGMANGLPVDAAVGRADVFTNMNYGEGSDTWSAHPIGCAGVLATLDEFESNDVLRRASQVEQVLASSLVALESLSAIANVRGEGTVWGVECAAAGSLSAEEVARRIVEQCYLGDDQGRAIHLLGPLAGKVIRVAPPLVMEPSEVRDYIEAMRGIIENSTT